MKIIIKDIKPEGIELKEDIAVNDIGLTARDMLNFAGPVAVTAWVEKFENVVLARTSVKSRLTTSCFRCLKDMELPWQKEFILDYPITPKTEFLEMGEDIRQEIVLNMPLKLLCREDCKGICAGCGADLNEEKCRCTNKTKNKPTVVEDETKHPTYKPFANLKDLE